MQSIFRSRAWGVIALAAWAAACGSDRDPGLRAVRLAEDRREPESAALVSALGSGEPALQVRAALAMARIQSPAYAGPLATAAAGSEREVRAAALFALGQLGLAEGAEPPARAVEACRRALDDADPEVVSTAVAALGKLAADDAADSIAPLLGHEAPQVRREAAYALFRLRFVPVWRRQSEQPPPLPSSAVEALVGALDDRDESVRQAAVYAFSRYGQPEAVAAIADLVGDPSEWVRMFAARALGRSQERSALAALARLLLDTSPRVRSEAIGAIAALDPSHSFPAPLGSDPSFHVRAALAGALGGSERADSIRRLRELERDDSPTVRAAAIEALARRLGPGYRPDLEELLDAEAWTTRVAAARALEHLGADGIPLARRAATDPDARVRAAALGTLPPGAGDDLIDAALASDDLAVRGTAVSVLARREDSGKLARLARAYEGSPGTEWVEIREALVDAAADLDAAEPLLRRMAGDPAPSVRSRAGRALRSRGVEVPVGDPPLPQPSPYLGTELATDPVVTLATSKGEIGMRCLSRQAPLHCANLVELVRRGFYDGLLWHRVVSNFVIQGGDPRGDGWGGSEPTLRDEINRQPFVRGAVGMPKAGKDTGSCQIFITHVPTPHLDGNYTIFGVVTRGMEVVDRIEVGDRIVRARVEP